MNTADYIVECLVAKGVSRIFGYPGIGNQALLDSIYRCPSVKFILVRHEQVAALMADAYARLTAFPSVCTATYGGGAANLVNGIAQAYFEMSPVIAIAGERPPSGERDIDQVSVFRPITKLSVSLKDPDQVPGIIKQAFHVASANPAGPVYIGVPTNVATIPVEHTAELYITPPESPLQHTPGSQLWPGALRPEDVMRMISDLMPSDAIVTVDVGDIMIYTSRFLEKKNREIIRPGRFYSMGFGLTSALAARIARPDSEVYCITGDGGLAMIVHDLETAVRENIKVTVIVLNNSCLSMIRRRQVANYDGRIIGCDVCDSDFAKIAHGFCMDGRRATSMDELKDGMEYALRSDRPYVIDVVVGWDKTL